MTRHDALLSAVPQPCGRVPAAVPAHRPQTLGMIEQARQRFRDGVLNGADARLRSPAAEDFLAQERASAG